MQNHTKTDPAHALEKVKTLRSVLFQVLMMRGDFGEVPFVCRDGTPPEPNAKAQSFAQVVGVVGGSSSTVSLQLASLFRLFTIPQVVLEHIHTENNPHTC